MESTITIFSLVITGWKAKAVFIAFLVAIFGLGFVWGKFL